MPDEKQLWIHVRETRAVTIRRPFQVVSALLADPLRYSDWAIDYFSGPVTELDDNTYRVSTVAGERRFRVDGDVRRGTFDLYLAPLDEAFSYPSPIRVLANGDGVDVLFTLAREPWLSDEEWDSSLRALENELSALRRLLEA